MIYKRKELASLLLSTLLLLILSRLTFAQPVTLVKDIFPGLVGSFPAEFTMANGTIFFMAHNSIAGFELWKSDGTVGRTALVKDIRPGDLNSFPGGFTDVNGTLFFTADDGTTGFELWKSDGTTAGTVLVKDIWPGRSGAVVQVSLNNINGTLFFVAVDGTNGTELWKSDGTAAGTTMIKDINPGPGNGFGSLNPTRFAKIGNTLFFPANDGTNGEELWKSDGTSAGTVLVKDINPGSADSFPAKLSNLNGTLLFIARLSTTGFELWKSDGTNTGTALVKDINPGATNGMSTSATKNDINFIVANNLRFFRASDGINGSELWKSDGTTSGTTLVKDINPGADSSLAPSATVHFAEVNGTVFFKADDGTNGKELWQSDGTTAGTLLTKDINAGPNSSSPLRMIDINGTLFFGANDGISGTELWMSDGTAAGTVLVQDIRPGPAGSIPASVAADFISLNGTLLLEASDGLFGEELRALQSPFLIALTPVNPPIQIPPSGGLFQFTVSLSNISGVTQNTEVWTLITIPNGETIGPTIGPLSPTLPPGESVTPTVSQNIPGIAPPGQYIYTFNVGTFPNTIDVSDSFTFTKSAGPVTQLSAHSESIINWDACWDCEAIAENTLPEIFFLEQNYPNPFNPSTTISYRLPQNEKVQINIYDLNGRRVRELVNGTQTAGAHTLQWDGQNNQGLTVAAGVYYYEIRAGKFIQTRKMVFLK